MFTRTPGTIRTTDSDGDADPQITPAPTPSDPPAADPPDYADAAGVNGGDKVILRQGSVYLFATLTQVWSGMQPASGELTALAALAGTGVVERTGAGAFSTFAISAFGKTLVAVNDATAGRTALALGTSATLNAPAAGDAAAGEVVKGDDSRLTDSRTPTAHTHAAGAITGLGTAAVADLPAPSFDASASQVVRGDDSRLSGARTPLAHAPSHATGGDDEITPASIGAATEDHTHDSEDFDVETGTGGELGDAGNFAVFNGSGQLEPGTVPPSDLITSIDRRLLGKTPASAKPIYSTQTHTGSPLYVRSADCWAVGIDLTCVSPWNSQAGIERAGTAISPRHIVLAYHFDDVPNTPMPTDGSVTFRFIATDGTIVDRTLTGKQRVGATDILIGLLNADLPDTITPARVLPSNYEGLIPVQGCPALIVDAEEKALVTQISSTSGNNISFTTSNDIVWSTFDEALGVGDSGSPLFLIAGNTPILLGTCETTNTVPDIAAFYNSVNAAMTLLGGGYQLTPVDISFYKLGTVGGNRLVIAAGGNRGSTITGVGAGLVALDVVGNAASGTGLQAYGGTVAVYGFVTGGGTAAGIFERFGAGHIAEFKASGTIMAFIDETGAIDTAGGVTADGDFETTAGMMISAGGFVSSGSLEYPALRPDILGNGSGIFFGGSDPDSCVFVFNGIAMAEYTGTTWYFYNGIALNFDDADAAATRVNLNAAIRNTVAVSQTGVNYTIVTTDEEKLIIRSNAAANTLVVPLNATAAFTVGCKVHFQQGGAGQTTVVPTGGVTINSRGGALKTAGQYAMATLLKTGSDTWQLTGDITT